MVIKEAIELFKEHQKGSVKKSTLKSYGKFMDCFLEKFSTCEAISVTADQIGRFLEESTEGLSRATRHLRYAQLKAFFNYVIEVTGLNAKNPRTAAVLAKAYKKVLHRPRKIFDKETVDEMIFNAGNLRDRLILELQARCGLRIGEVLNLKVSDLSGRKIVIQEPKPGRDAEVAFMAEHIAARLAKYVAAKQLFPTDRVFPLCYTTVRNLVTGLGKKLNVKISPHDLRRHLATYASRNGVPLEIISKVILRHQDLKTTQIYLGKISDTEAIRWMDILHGK
ncbi:Integrase/recombinase [Candidatus Sulfobium mesophilum]|uniref:Integrase/recombinase n=1 Tax=Candidatus Sulfobium mesophilum TaxID=2016548 RepID=A0A2U3QKS5_9BACT|nr:Integrase/recombinase [Candidatus Sulfobium mesophilum]